VTSSAANDTPRCPPRGPILVEILLGDVINGNSRVRFHAPQEAIGVSHILGEVWFLLDVQAHYAIPGELVEGGQLLALHYSPARNEARRSPSRQAGPTGP